MKHVLFRPAALLLGFLCLAPRSVDAAEAATRKDYAVVVSQSTGDRDDWKPVVEALVQKHGATVIVYDKAVAESLDALRVQFPRLTCFVATPAEATRQFVAEVHRLTRQLDDDPYTDTRWGILTGYDAAGALAIARHDKPLVIRKVASGTEIALDCCEQGLWYDELVRGKTVRKRPGGKIEQTRGPDDTTAALVDTLTPWINLAIEQGMKDSPMQAAMVAGQVQIVLDVIKVLRTVTSESYFEDGALVTHSLTEIRDIEE